MKIYANRNKSNKQPITASSNGGTTTDLSDFGYRELELLKDLIDALLTSGTPEDFYDDEVVPMMNTHSGNVFLTNSDYQVAMEVDGKLESWHFTPYSGYEGFYEDLLDEADNSWDYEDLEYLKDIAEMRGDGEGVEKLTTLMAEVGE